MQKKMQEEHGKMMNASSTMNDERKQEMQDRRDEMQKKQMEKRGEILKRNAMKMIERMNAAIERLEKLADRIDSRITKLKEKGVDTTKTIAYLVNARAKIADAKTAVIAAKA